MRKMILGFLTLTFVALTSATQVFASAVAVREVVVAAQKAFGTAGNAAGAIASTVNSLNAAGATDALETANEILTDDSFRSLIKEAQSGAYNSVGKKGAQVTSAQTVGMISQNVRSYLELAKEKALPKLSAKRFVEKLREYLTEGALASLNKTYETALIRIYSNAKKESKDQVAPEDLLKSAFAANWIANNEKIKGLLAKGDKDAASKEINSLWNQFVTECL